MRSCHPLISEIDFTMFVGTLFHPKELFELDSSITWANPFNKIDLGNILIMILHRNVYPKLTEMNSSILLVHC